MLKCGGFALKVMNGRRPSGQEFFLKMDAPIVQIKKACPDNCLATLYSWLSKEWYLEKNELTPNDVLPNTKKKKCGGNVLMVMNGERGLAIG